MNVYMAVCEREFGGGVVVGFVCYYISGKVSPVAVSIVCYYYWMMSEIICCAQSFAS